MGIRYVSRRHLISRKDEAVLIVETDRVSVLKNDQKFFFHPSLAVIRKSNIDSGQRDYLIESLALDGDEEVLDCTFGLGSEAILIAHFLPYGKVIGVEKSPIVKIVVEDGMKHTENLYKWIREAVMRIEIIEADYKEYVRNSERKFDCVYVDPMFEHPRYNSAAMNSMRPFADHSTISSEDIEAMKKKAKKRVVVKARWNDSIFEKYDFDYVVGSEKSDTGYGVVKI